MTTTKKKTMKQLRDDVERAQLEAQLKYLANPEHATPPVVQGLEIKPRTRCFLYRTEFKETKETLTAMANDLAKSMGEERIAIVNVTGDADFREL